MRTVFKYEIRHGLQVLHLPIGARALKAGVQNGKMYLWFELIAHPDRPLQTREFHVFGTGWNIPSDTDKVNFVYIDTVFPDDGFVWHIYELVEVK